VVESKWEHEGKELVILCKYKRNIFLCQLEIVWMALGTIGCVAINMYYKVMLVR